jgi:hypothetical protein
LIILTSSCLTQTMAWAKSSKRSFIGSSGDCNDTLPFLSEWMSSVVSYRFGSRTFPSKLECLNGIILLFIVWNKTFSVVVKCHLKINK